jgi:hypothetical protein
MGKGNQPDQGSDKTAFRNRRRRPRPRKPGQPDGSSSPESNP